MLTLEIAGVHGQLHGMVFLTHKLYTNINLIMLKALLEHCSLQVVDHSIR